MRSVLGLAEIGEVANPTDGAIGQPLMKRAELQTKTLPLWAFILVLVLVPAQSLMAQIESATVSGLVLDSSGLPIPAAVVTARETTTNVSRETITNAAGPMPSLFLSRVVMRFAQTRRISNRRHHFSQRK